MTKQATKTTVMFHEVISAAIAAATAKGLTKPEDQATVILAAIEADKRLGIYQNRNVVLASEAPAQPAPAPATAPEVPVLETKAEPSSDAADVEAENQALVESVAAAEAPKPKGRNRKAA